MVHHPPGVPFHPGVHLIPLALSRRSAFGCDRCTGQPFRHGLIINKLQWRVAIRMVGRSFMDLSGTLSTIARIMQEGGHGARTDGMAFSL